jgi:hypothetical protein
MFSLDNLRGKLEIYKDYGDFVEKVGEYHNIVTRGMGITLAAAMTSGSRNTKNPFSIRYAQLGTGVVDYLRYTSTSESRYNFFKLNSALSKDSYGKNLRTPLETRTQLAVTNEFSTTGDLLYTTEQGSFLKIPDSRVTIKKDAGILVTLVIDKNMANGVTLKEVGLFSDNVAIDGTQESVLVAYKQFSPITKQNDFSIIFSWTIQAVDFGNVETWQTESTTAPISPGGPTDPPTTDKGSGGTTDQPPTFSYGLSVDNPWLIQIGSPFEEIIPTCVPSDGFSTSSFGFAPSAPTPFSINAIDGKITAKHILASDVGIGVFFVSAQPSSTNYNTYTKRVYYSVTNPKTIPTDSGASFIGQIAWTVPSGAVVGASTVINCVMPTSSGDFTAATFGSRTRWLVSGAGTTAFNSSGFVAQIHDVVRDASGGRETVDVIFPTTITTAAGGIQYYDIYSTSSTLPSDTLTIPSYIKDNLYFYVKDLSGYQYRGNIWSGAATTSSLLKDGPYKRVYRFYTRMLPQSWSTTSPTDEKKPFALGVHVYLTIKKDDPVVGLDFRISNGNYDFQNIDSGKGIGTVLQNENQVLGNFYYSDLWFEVSSGVSAVSELERYSNVYAGNTYGSVDKYGLVIPEESIPEWVIRNTRDDIVPLETNFPGANLSADQKVMAFNIHGIGKMKKFHRRFRLFPVDNQYVTYEYAKEVGQFGDVAFPSRQRTWWRIPKWGPTKDLAPLITDDFTSTKSFAGTYFDFAIGNKYHQVYPIKTSLPGMAGYNLIIDNLYKHFEETSKYGLCRFDRTNDTNMGNNYGGIGTRGFNFINYQVISNPQDFNGYTGNDVNTFNYTWMKRIKTPFTCFASKNMDIGGLATIHLYKGLFLNNKYLRLLNAETNFTTDRFYGIYDFSGVAINPGMVMNHYAITSSTTTPTDIYEYCFGGYPSFKTVDSNGRPFSFPKIYGARKSNSKLCEPYESDLRYNIAKLRPDPILNDNGTIQYGNPDNYLLVNACKYSYFSMPINGQELFNSVIAGYRPASSEHTSRIFPLMHAITTLTNDEMWKEEFEAIAGFYAIAMNPYPSSVNMPVPVSVYSGGGQAYGKDFSLAQYYNVLNTTPAGHGNGSIGNFANVRFLAFGIAGPTMYYQLANNDWRNKNQLLFNYASSALYYSFIRENGLIGGLHIGTGADPNPNNVIEILAAGNTFSSIPSQSDRSYYLFNPSGKSFPVGNSVTWEDPPPVAYPTLSKTGDSSIYAQGGIFNASSLWVTVMQSHYQVYMFRCLAKSVKEFDPIIASGLNYACSSVARTLFKDAFYNFSGCAEMPELPELLNNYDGGTLRSELTKNPLADRNILSRHTIGGALLGNVDPTKTEGGPPHFILSNTNSWYYPAWKRGTNLNGNGNFTIGNPARGYSGGDFNNMPSRSGFLRSDGEYTLAIAAIITAGDNISNLTSSNEYLNRAAWFKSNYSVINTILDPAWTAGDYNTTMQRALERTRIITPSDKDVNTPSVVGLYNVAPLIAYIQYVLGINGNNT